jgi:hypothetical protein
LNVEITNFTNNCFKLLSISFLAAYLSKGFLVFIPNLNILLFILLFIGLSLITRLTWKWMMHVFFVVNLWGDIGWHSLYLFHYVLSLLIFISFVVMPSFLWRVFSEELFDGNINLFFLNFIEKIMNLFEFNSCIILSLTSSEVFN